MSNIPSDVRPHVKICVEALQEAEEEAEVWYAVLTLSAKLKLRDDGRNIDELTQAETDKIVFEWVDGKRRSEAEHYLDVAIEYILEYIEEEEIDL